ncbi:MAG TPA: Nif3-like dinuclear metal center hexameric protein [Puia sp.]|nr:Nif3-like dinuclear metal center hexameric protein [Puia sp.]
MDISEIIAFLEVLAPPAYQEHYDNAGLLTGGSGWECRGVLVTLDATEEVVLEAAARGCNLVVAHHPIIFGGLRKITGRNYAERSVIAAIKNDIAIYAIHTNLDNVMAGGVNGRIADTLGLEGRRVLLPRVSTLSKLVCWVPVAQVEAVRAVVFGAGAGNIGNYSECSFGVEGTGTFKGGEGAQPFVGQVGMRHSEKEVRLEVILPVHLSNAVVAAMISAHPYEEVAYDLVPLANEQGGIGAGLVGELAVPMEEEALLEQLCGVFGVPVVRHTRLTGRQVRRVAVCGGAGSFLISSALAAGANFYITSDVKYHEFMDANDQLVIADIGHFESEQFTVDLVIGHLREKFSNFALLKSDTRTNPVHYHIGIKSN